MRHHEDAVHGQLGEPQRLIGVHHHEERLHPSRRMGEDAAAADDQVELQHVHPRLPGPLLLEDVRDRPLLLHAFEAGRQRLVMDQGQPQGLPGDGLLDLEFVKGLRHGGGADHLVLDPVAQVLLVDRERHPAHDVVEAGFGQHVRNAVAHPQVGGHGPVEDALEDGKHVGRRAADVHADQVDPLLLRDGLHDEAHRGRRRHDRRAGPRNQLLVARRLGHDVLEEQIVDLVAGGREVLLFQRRPQVLRDGQGRLLRKNLRDALARLLVAGVDQRQVIAHAQARAGLGGGNVFRHLHHVHDRAAVRAARQQNHVRPQGADALDLLVRQAAVVRGQHVHDDRPRPEGAPLRALGRHALHHAGDHHLEAAAGAARGDVDVHPGFRVSTHAARRHDLFPVENLPAGQLLDLRNRVEHPARDVLEGGFDGGRRLPAIGLPVLPADFLDQDRLRRRAAAVRGDDRLERPAWIGGHGRAAARRLSAWRSIRAVSRDSVSRRSSRSATRSMSRWGKTTSRMGVKKCRAWLPRKFMGPTDSRNTTVGTAIRRSTTATATRSSNVTSSADRGWPSGSTAKAC